MKLLIVNGDDFGVTQGVNRGIAEVAQKGILTSTSVMINRPYAKEVTTFKKDCPNIGIGIHLEFPEELLTKYATGKIIDETEILDLIENQIKKFKELAGFSPDHMDFHKVAVRASKKFVTKDISVFKIPIEKISQKYQLPWRGMEGITVIDWFHGAIYDPITHKKSQTVLEKISPEALVKILATLTDGKYELMAHPGYVDDETTSSYAVERETELKTLTDPKVKEEIERLGIKLITYSQLKSLGVKI